MAIVNDSSIQVLTSNSEAVKQKIMGAMDRALRIIGMKAESYAKAMCPVDTGLLRNSITYAIGGETPNTAEYRADRGEGSGSYSTSAPNDSDSSITLYVGTNVEYGVYQELGHHTTSGSFVQPQEFLRPAMQNHTAEYAKVIQTELNKL